MVDRIAVLGSTGSIGVNTLDVVRRHQDRFEVYALAAQSSVEKMYEQCMQFKPRYVLMADEKAGAELVRMLSVDDFAGEVISGEDAINCMAADGMVDTVICGIVGAAGLLSTLAAVDAGKRVLIANKEPLVMMGAEIRVRAEASGALILPIDSEHNAIFQCLPDRLLIDRKGAPTAAPEESGIRRIILTGSGGPFRDLPHEAFNDVEPEQAIKHPNWVMGPKISIDSATMMNKALELIEACSLFNVSADDIDIVIHPQSIIHSMVEYIDGSFLAQMGSADMRIPIANALGWPDRLQSGAESLDFTRINKLNFESVDRSKFPAVVLGEHAARCGGTLPTVMNAANEVAVEAFLNRSTRFDLIPQLVEKTMSLCDHDRRSDFESVMAADFEARKVAAEQLSILGT